MSLIIYQAGDILTSEVAADEMQSTAVGYS